MKSKPNIVAGGQGGHTPEVVGWYLNMDSGFWGLVCYATTQLAIQLQQERIQVVRSNRDARKCPTESNGTLAVDFEFENIRIRRYTNKKRIEQNTCPQTRNIHDKHKSETETSFSFYLLYLGHSCNGTWTSSHTHTNVGNQKRNRTKHTF